MSGETLKGHLDLLLLAIVAERPAHGYAIIEALRDRSEGAFDLPEGTVYPALHRLEEAGSMQSHWATGASRKRRIYELTVAGRKALQVKRQEWSDFASGVGAILREMA
jgi:DNA-binding PadR family transcriptional regulator